MNSSLKPLLIVGTVLIVAIGGVVTYAIVNSNTTNQMKPHVHDGSHSHSSPDTKKVNQVTITNYAYEPVTIEVKVGTTVTWTNQDSVEHTVTTQDSAPESFDSGLFGKGETFSYTFEAAGQYDYYCLPHPYMKGTVIVTE